MGRKKKRLLYRLEKQRREQTNASLGNENSVAQEALKEKLEMSKVSVEEKPKTVEIKKETVEEKTVTTKRTTAKKKVAPKRTSPKKTTRTRAKNNSSK